MKKVLIALALLLPMVVSAHDIEVANDGVTIYYRWTNNNTELAVSFRGSYSGQYSNEYSGDVVIPETVIYNDVTYPVTSIGYEAFYGCSGLTSLTIPNSVTSIGYNAFYETAWYNNQPDGLVYVGKVAYNYKGTMPANTSLSLLEGTLGIADYAFYDCSDLTSVTIPNSVTSIGSYAFLNCSGLTSVTIPNSVTSIGSYAFKNCSGVLTVNCNLPDVKSGDSPFGDSIFNEVIFGDEVTSICSYAFYQCPNLTSVTIPNSVTSIGDYAFANCSRLESVTLGTGVSSIGKYVFLNHQPSKVIWLTNTPPYGCGNAEGKVNYVANDQYTSLSNKTVYPFLSSMFEVGGVKYVLVSPSERTCDAIDCVYGDEAADVTIGETVSYKGVQLTVSKVQKYTFFQNLYIINVELSYHGNIEDYTFSGCTGLKTALLGEAITGIGVYGFNDCSQLEDIILPKTVISLSPCAFQNCTSIQDIEIPQSVTTINNGVFIGCTGLKNVLIADRSTELWLGSNGSYPLFSSCPLDSVYIGGKINYEKTSNNGSPFSHNTSLRAVMITDKETEISENEFYGCTNLKNVYIGDGVTTIGNRAFSGCSSLDSFAFGSSVESIGQEAFSDCTALTKIVSKAETPPTCGVNALDDISKWDCTLYIPVGTKASYQAADQWKEFFFLKEGTGEGEEPVLGEKCATPTIAFANGTLTFDCETAGVDFHYTITNDNSPSGVGNNIPVSNTYRVSVYATKYGYENSDVATLEINSGGQSGKVGDVNGDGEITISDAVGIANIILGNQ